MLNKKKVHLSLCGFTVMWVIFTGVMMSVGAEFMEHYYIWARILWTLPSVMILRRYGSDLPARLSDIILHKIDKKSFLYVLTIVIIVDTIFYTMIESVNIRDIGWVMICLVTAVCEELVYRGYGLNALYSYSKIGRATRLSNIYFVAMHTLSTIVLYRTGSINMHSCLIYITFAIICGVLCGHLYKKSKSIITPIVIHFLLALFLLY